MGYEYFEGHAFRSPAVGPLRFVLGVTLDRKLICFHEAQRKRVGDEGGAHAISHKSAMPPSTIRPQGSLSRVVKN